MQDVPIQTVRSPTTWYHDDVIKWKHFSRYWPFVRGIHRSPMDSPHKASHTALWYFLWSASEQTNGWANNRDASFLRRHRAHYDVTVMDTRKYSMFQNHVFCSQFATPQLSFSLVSICKKIRWRRVTRFKRQRLRVGLKIVSSCV